MVGGLGLVLWTIAAGGFDPAGGGHQGRGALECAGGRGGRRVLVPGKVLGDDVLCLWGNRYGKSIKSDAIKECFSNWMATKNVHKK